MCAQDAYVAVRWIQEILRALDCPSEDKWTRCELLQMLYNSQDIQLIILSIEGVS